MFKGSKSHVNLSLRRTSLKGGIEYQDSVFSTVRLEGDYHYISGSINYIMVSTVSITLGYWHWIVQLCQLVLDWFWLSLRAGLVPKVSLVISVPNETWNRSEQGDNFIKWDKLLLLLRFTDFASVQSKVLFKTITAVFPSRKFSEPVMLTICLTAWCPSLWIFWRPYSRTWSHPASDA